MTTPLAVIASGAKQSRAGGALTVAARPRMTDLPSFDITGQVALVTGASSGIGEHFAEVLAAAGAKVAAAARRADRLAELARRIEAGGGTCLPVSCDVTD